MLKSDKDILKQFADELVRRLRENLRSNERYASGDTEKSIENETTDNSLVIYARPHTWTLEYGRKPTPGSDIKPSRDFVAKIQRWINAKGLDLPAYAVARKIHRDGFEGTPGIITDVLGEKAVDELVKRLADNYVIKIIDNDTINKLSTEAAK